MTDDVSQRVAQIIAEQAMLDPESIQPETTLDDLGLDSLSVVEVVFGIEEAFDISVPFNANEPENSEFKISKFKHIVAGVKSLIAAKAKAKG